MKSGCRVLVRNSDGDVVVDSAIILKCVLRSGI
jgi:hypothetical protein